MLRCLPGLLTALILAGCSGGSESAPLEMIAVNGTVTVNQEPVPGVSIAFVPVQETLGDGGYGGTDDLGIFSLKYRDGRDGIPPGEYRVVFSRILKPDGTLLGPDEMAADAGAENVLPERYAAPETTPVRAVVTKADSTFSFDVTTK